ncbi:pilin [Luteimonas sp. Sa2BVA3]|uniref:Pilin n=1 Tax=Luteimonas colneyensis TaxID=2762230 RepID=A0ABR8UIT7_9GAMM|nr:pilin [Luteimonas colneyensis]MBD7987952.1 pilin [Luteimonas colneyensis]
MKRAQGFTLIELMIVVAIIAILAAIALPAYQDYVARSQVSEGFSLSTDARMAIVVYHADRASYPVDNTQAGISTAASIVGDYVESVTIGNGNGQIDVLFGNEASAKIAGQSLVMTMVDEGGAFHWRCSGLESKYLPSVCR